MVVILAGGPHMRRLLSLSVLLIILGSVSHLVAQSQAGASSTGSSSTGQTTDPNPSATHPNAQPADPGAKGTSGQAPQAAGGQNTPRPAPQTPGVRPYGVSVGDKVTVGGYGSVRYETNSLEEPKPAGFDFRRFVLTT